ncbi:MAG: deoxyribodipyrimidine photo-lyase [Chloroflexota bacterium]
MEQQRVQIVWFKRDLRIHDHAPLAQAAQHGPVVPLYIVEPSVVRALDFSPSHWTFIRCSLYELREQLGRLGQPLIVHVGEAVPVLEALSQQFDVADLWAHEETGNAVTYVRDRAVRRWARTKGIRLTEIPQHGVVRRLKSRDVWARTWESRMRESVAQPPTSLHPIDDLVIGSIPEHHDIGLGSDTCEIQQGGESQAHLLLDSFLQQRGANYQREMSSPLTAPDSCSRLSPHLAWGTISMRHVVQTMRARTQAIRLLTLEERKALGGSWLRSLSAFEARLHWHCHFIQKLEDEPEIEFENFVRSFNGLREQEWNTDHYEAWCAGQTGFPMVDACMRSLATTGWLNFRMRAMIVSFAAYDLWLHWRDFGHFLARQWLDYEPGIHYSQIQMQSGTTGINTLRIYNPVKQGQEHDPDGVFVRRWVPELAGVPTSFVHAPWLMTTEMQHTAGCQIGKNYPEPIVQHEAAVARARARIGEIRRRQETRSEADAVQQRHGSRRKSSRSRGRRGQPSASHNQLKLDL